MRACSALLAVCFVLAACSNAHHRTSNRASLAALRHLTADRANFGVILDAKTGHAVAAFRVNNPIRAAVPDGRGGWYVGGGFIHVDGVLRKRLAHIDRDGRLDPDWKPEANGNGVSVASLARIGSRLYVAGDFARLQHAPRAHVGALDVATGALDASWRPTDKRPFWNPVLLAADGRLIIGGGACCAESTALAALDAETGELDPSWRARVDAANLEGGGVSALARAGSNIFVDGIYRSVDDVRRPGLAAVDAATGRLVRTWRPPSNPKACPFCWLVAFAAGHGRVYGSVNGPARYRLVALDARSGRVDTRWHARLSATTEIYGGSYAQALAVTHGRVYATGDFGRINGVARNGFAALDPATARVLSSWQPRANGVYGWLLVPSGDRLLLGLSLTRALQFNFAGLKTFRPVRTLRLVLALSGTGRVRIGLGRGCDVQRWEQSSTLRCSGRLLRWLSSVGFEHAGRKRYVHGLHVPPGRYFVRFVPQSPKGVPQPSVQDFPIAVP